MFTFGPNYKLRARQVLFKFGSINVLRLSPVVRDSYVSPDFLTTSLRRYLFIYSLSQVLQATLKKRSSNFTELFHDKSGIQAIREQSVAQFSKLLADHAKRRITLNSFVIFKAKAVVKAFHKYYRINSWKHAKKFRGN